MSKIKVIAGAVLGTVGMTGVALGKGIKRAKIAKQYEKVLEDIKQWQVKTEDRIRWDELKDMEYVFKDLKLWNKLNEWQQDNLKKEIKRVNSRISEKVLERRLKEKRERVDENLQKEFYKIQRWFEEKYRNKEEINIENLRMNLGIIDTVQKEKIDKSLQEMILKAKSL